MPPEIYSRICVQCTKSFDTIYPEKKYCSLRCRRYKGIRVRRRRERDLVCTVCQLPFRACQRGGTKPKYCPTCRSQKRSEASRVNASKAAVTRRQKTERALIGKRFNGLVVVGPSADPDKWLCECDCGNIKPISVSHVRRGEIKTCGCQQFESRRQYRSAGALRTLESWKAMKDRCLNPGRVNYSHYGGAGVTICDRWQGKDGFNNFLVDLGERPKGTSLSRFADAGNYEPGNVTWHTRREQAAEQTKKRLLKAAAEKLTLDTPKFLPAFTESAVHQSI